MMRSKTSSATGTRPGCATQVPSWPSLASRSLSARTLRERRLVGLGIVLDRDLRGHAAHGVNAAAVAGLDAAASSRLRMKCAVMVTCARSGSTKSAWSPELLDEAEDVIPAAAVEAGGVVAQLVEDLVHLERGEDGLDQHGGADGAARDAELVLRADEDVVPEARFEVALHLGQIEVGAGAARRAARFALWKK